LILKCCCTDYLFFESKVESGMVLICIWILISCDTLILTQSQRSYLSGVPIQVLILGHPLVPLPSKKEESQARGNNQLPNFQRKGQRDYPQRKGERDSTSTAPSSTPKRSEATGQLHQAQTPNPQGERVAYPLSRAEQLEVTHRACGRGS
jgi:hypothetical protein